MIMPTDIVLKNHKCVMIALDDYPTAATGFFGTNFSEVMGKLFVILVGTTG